MNIQEHITRQLKPGEELVRVVRRHPAVLLPAVTGGGLLLLADFFLLAWWFSRGWWGGLLWLLFFGLAAGWIFRTLYSWSQNVLVLTNQRVIDINQRGVFDRRVAEAPYEKIQDVRYTIRGFWSTILSFGSVKLHTASHDTDLELTNIRRPLELQQLITDLIGHAKSYAAPDKLSADELLSIVARLKTELGPEKAAYLFKPGPNGR